MMGPWRWGYVDIWGRSLKAFRQDVRNPMDWIERGTDRWDPRYRWQLVSEFSYD